MYQVGSALWVAVSAHVHLDCCLRACLCQLVWTLCLEPVQLPWLLMQYLCNAVRWIADHALLRQSFSTVQVVQHWEIPVWGVYIASFLTFGIGVLGISYGVISASWTAQEGSALGIQEFKKNLPFALDRLRGR